MNSIHHISSLHMPGNCNRVSKASSRPHCSTAAAGSTAIGRKRNAMLQNQYLARYLAQQEKNYQSLAQTTHQYLTSPESCPPSTFDSSPPQWNVSPDLSWSEYASPSIARDCSDNTSSPTYCLLPTAANLQHAYDCATNYAAADPFVAGLYQNAQMNGSMVTSPYHFPPLMFAESDSTCTTATSTPESLPAQQQSQPPQQGFDDTAKDVLPVVMDEDEDELVGIGLYEDPETLAREEEACISGHLMEPHGLFYPSMHTQQTQMAQKKRKPMILEQAYDPSSASARKTRKHSAKHTSHHKVTENKENLPPTQASGAFLTSDVYEHYAQLLNHGIGFNGYPNTHIQQPQQQQQQQQQQQGWTQSTIPNMAAMMAPPSSSNSTIPMEGLSFGPAFV